MTFPAPFYIPYVWLPLCAVFVLGLLDWRRLRRTAHLDLLVIVAGFGISHYFFGRADLGASVGLAYAALAYLLARMLWLAFRGGDGLRPAAPATWLLIGALALTGFKLWLNVTSDAHDVGVLDVGYAGVIGADRIVDGEPLYGNFPAENETGDTYGPVAYYAYVPFEQALPWSGEWDELPAAHAAAIFFDLATLGGLFLLGRRLRKGEMGTALGAALAFAWAACPYTAFALEPSTNDALVAALVVATLLVIESPALRGAALALATATKLAPGLLFPLLATYPRSPATGAADKRRPSRALARYAAAFALTIAIVSAQFLLDPGVTTVWERTIGFQLDRESAFTIWGQAPSLEWLRTPFRVAVVALALLVALRPRRGDLVAIAALGAAVLIAGQLSAGYWFYLYIPWFLPLVFVALLARPSAPGAEKGHR